MYKHLVAFFALIVPIIVFSQPNVHLFEGSIIMVRETVFDTTQINILVKGHMVRVEEYDCKKNLLSSHLVNLDDETIMALCSNRKQYVHLPVNTLPKNLTSSLEVMKTENYKEINGFTCYQWRVRDKKRNTEVAYWVSQQRFDFYEPLLNLLHRCEISLTIFPSISDNQNFFPMLTEERTLLRKRKLQIAVVDIIESNLNPNLFQIPAGYTALRRL